MHELTLCEHLLRQQQASQLAWVTSHSLMVCSIAQLAAGQDCHTAPGLTWSSRMSRNLAALNSVAPNMLWKGSWAALWMRA